MKVIQETCRTHYIIYLRLYYCHQVNTSAGRLLVLEGSIPLLVDYQFFRGRYLCWQTISSSGVDTSAGRLLVLQGIVRPVVVTHMLYQIYCYKSIVSQTLQDIGCPVQARWFSCSFCLSTILALSVRDEGYSSNASCALKLMSYFSSIYVIHNIRLNIDVCTLMEL